MIAQEFSNPWVGFDGKMWREVQVIVHHNHVRIYLQVFVAMRWETV